MNKLFKILIILVAVFCIFSVHNGLLNSQQHIKVEAKTVYMENLPFMEDYSDVIVKCKRLNGEEAVITKSQGMVVSTYSFSQVEIINVYKDIHNALETGSIITILENEAYDETDNTVYHVAGYNMMKEGEEYLLFLTRHTKPDGSLYYVAAGINYGTVSMNEDGREQSARTVNGNLVSNFSYYQDIWNDAREKYGE